MDPTPLEVFLDAVESVFTAITQGISLFTTPPLSYFVALGFAAAGVGIAKRLVPRKRAK